MIKLENITKSFGHTTVLSHINLAVQAGEIVGIIGESGAGKSTLLRCINLLEPPTEGKVFINSHELTTLSPAALRQARHQIGMIFQHFNLIESKNVFQNIALALKIINHPHDKIHARVLELLNLVGLTEKEQAYPSQLSGGQKQRIAIARALASNPTVLLCDEATSALDPESTAGILALLKSLNQRLNLTIVLITHEINVVKQICDTVMLLDKGQIIEKQKLLPFFEAPKTSLAKKVVQTALIQPLPEAFRDKLLSAPTHDANCILRIYFHGDATKEPIVHDLISDFSLSINILQANIQYIQKSLLGNMLIEILNHTAVPKAIETFLSQKQLRWETIGYVANTDRTP